MNLFTHQHRSPEARAIRERIFNVIPAATYQMEKLLGLLDIELTREVETAAVDCSHTPRLELNPDFLEEYCQSDGDLFLLVLHELYHVILGHTRLFKRVTYSDNVAFDAVINAILARTVGLSVGVHLFTSVNPFNEFPALLLRPPPGWPGSFDKALEELPVKQRKAVELLYGSQEGQVTYLDIYEALRTAFNEDGSVPKNESSASFNKEAPQAAEETEHPVLSPCVLLGNHGRETPEKPLLKDVVRNIVEGWPPPPQRIAGRDEGASASSYFLDGSQKPGAAFKKAFKKLLRKCGIYTGTGPAIYQPKLTRCERVNETVLPDARDRRIPTLRALTGVAPLIYRTTTWADRVRPARVSTVHLYLDISGSMTSLLPYLTEVCRDPFRRGELKVYGFSTVISEAKGTDLAKAAFRNTGGTDITAVLQHVVGFPKKKRPRRVLIVTDGYVGTPPQKLVSQLGKIRVCAGLTAPHYDRDVRGWVREIVELPAI